MKLSDAQQAGLIIAVAGVAYVAYRKRKEAQAPPPPPPPPPPKGKFRGRQTTRREKLAILGGFIRDEPPGCGPATMCDMESGYTLPVNAGSIESW